jgi:hypothetical protein
MPKPSITSAEPVELLIREIRGLRVILDADLARVYGVSTKRLNEAIRRNRSRFPSDSMFQLSAAEFDPLRSQSAASRASARPSHGGRHCRPNAFAEQGANRALAAKVAEQEKALLARLVAHDHLITGNINQLIQLAKPPQKNRKEIGFHVRARRSTYKTRKKS